MKDKAKHTKAKKDQDLSTKVSELTVDLQRLQADFENYRKRVEGEKLSIGELSKAATIMKLLPVIDNIERAAYHIPADLAENQWAKGIASLVKGLEKSLNELGLKRIEASTGTPFDPNLHEAIIMEEGQGETEVISEELRTGYRLGEQVIRPSMVKVSKR